MAHLDACEKLNWQLGISVNAGPLGEVSLRFLFEVQTYQHIMNSGVQSFPPKVILLTYAIIILNRCLFGC